MYWYGGVLKLKCFFLKGSSRFREGPCTRKSRVCLADTGLWPCAFPAVSPWSRRALPPAHSSPTASQEHHPQLQLFPCWQKWSCPLSGCTSTCEGCKNCPGSSFLDQIWCVLEVIWFLDDIDINFSSVPHLHWHKKRRSWYFSNHKQTIIKRS